MPRTLQNAKIDSRTARSKLAGRREPYWTVLSTGCAIGYRKGSNGGTWVARFRADTKQHYEALGAADDVRDPDGISALNFSQAQAKARAFFERKSLELAGNAGPQGPYNVNAALDDYFIERERRGSKGVERDRYAASARIRPALGVIEISKLTTARIRTWQTDTERSGKLTRKAAASPYTEVKPLDRTNADAIRARKATANRLLTILKAALNYAFHEGRVSSDEAWRKVKPAREVDSPIVQFLSPAECVRLVNACSGRFKELVQGALVTGCRYGELSRLTVNDVNLNAGNVTINLSKSGKRRHVALNAEGVKLFEQLTIGKKRSELVFKRDTGGSWGPSLQQRPIEEASKAARLDPPATFHILRHTYASALASKGVPMRIIADQLGHADTRITERHYAHLAPSHVADVVRAALPGFGILENNNVTAIGQRR